MLRKHCEVVSSLVLYGSGCRSTDLPLLCTILQGNLLNLPYPLQDSLAHFSSVVECFLVFLRDFKLTFHNLLSFLILFRAQLNLEAVLCCFLILFWLHCLCFFLFSVKFSSSLYLLTAIWPYKCTDSNTDVQTHGHIQIYQQAYKCMDVPTDVWTCQRAIYVCHTRQNARQYMYL